MERKSHWENVYQQVDCSRVSWFRPHLELSLQLIDSIALPHSAQIIDIGGGCSTLVDDLLGRGFTKITVLDISSHAIQLAKQRLGDRSQHVTWIEADITTAQLSEKRYDLWHDRAVFHFLTAPEDRKAYVLTAQRALKPGAHMIIATFSPEAPPKCSGLDVVRYTSSSLSREFADNFELVEALEQEHRTPSGVRQPYIYCHFKKIRDAE